MGRPTGRARVDRSNPQAFAVCDRCGRWYNHIELQWQFDYRGKNLANLRILVCDNCLDVPQQQLRPKILTPDPVAIPNPRLEQFYIDESNFLVTDVDEFPFVTEDGERFLTMEGP